MTDAGERDEREIEMPEGVSFCFSLILAATGLFDGKQQRTIGTSEATFQYMLHQRLCSLCWSELSHFSSLPCKENHLYDTLFKGELITSWKM